MKYLLSGLLIITAVHANAQFDQRNTNDTIQLFQYELRHSAETYRIKARNSYIFSFFSAAIGYGMYTASMASFSKEQGNSDLYRNGSYVCYGIALIAVINGSIQMEHYFDKRKQNISFLINDKGIGFAIKLDR